MKTDSLKTSAMRRGVLAAALLGALSIPVLAKTAPPVALSLGSPDAVRAGRPVTVYVVIQAAANLPLASFSVLPSKDWQILDGISSWTGSLSVDSTNEFEFRAVPLVDEPESLLGSLRVGNILARIARLEPRRMGGKFPERGRESDEDRKNRNETEEPAARDAQPDAGIVEPAAATEPRIPGQPPAGATAKGRAKNLRRAAAVSVTATGRFTFFDNNNIRRGVRRATVELWNQNPFPSLGDEKCASGLTDTNGNFTLTAVCGDWDSNPDLFVRIVLNNTIVEVKPDSIFSGSYTFQTGVQNNVSGTVGFGTITINTNQEAFHLHNLIMRAHGFMSELGENLSKVTMNFPAAESFYVPAFSSISMEDDIPFTRERTVFHEYGHHVLHTLSESPSPDYNNGNCDTPDPGHCMLQPELGVISWTEGWPHFFARVVLARFAATDGLGSTLELEDLDNPADFTFQGQEDRTEGVIAAILWDLFDTIVDDMTPLGDGRRDNFSMPFEVMWQIIRQFDPSTDIFHNHPTSIHEFYSGLRAFRLDDINRIAEIYAEHNILKAQPNLQVTAISNPPAGIALGMTFTITYTARNAGGERANAGSLTRFELVPEFGTPLLLTAGDLVPANFLPGATSTDSVTLQVPSRMNRGVYRVRACTDFGRTVPERDETDNCRLSSGTAVLR